MKRTALLLISICLWAGGLVLPRIALGWGNETTHEVLADEALDRAGQNEAFERYLQEQLGLENGVQEELALQLGFDDVLDREIGSVRRSRLNRSSNTIPDFFESAPAIARIEINEKCVDGPQSVCFENLQRSSIDQLFRAGVWAEDNPNARAKHHFHDPERDHGPPTDNRGLDNTAKWLLGVDVFLAELVTLFRGGNLLRALTGLVVAPAQPFADIDAHRGLPRPPRCPGQALPLRRLERLRPLAAARRASQEAPWEAAIQMNRSLPNNME